MSQTTLLVGKLSGWLFVKMSWRWRGGQPRAVQRKLWGLGPPVLETPLCGQGVDGT